MGLQVFYIIVVGIEVFYDEIMYPIQTHPQWPAVLEVASRIQSQGHQIFLVGGCVRDILLNREPKDFDFATSMSPNQMETSFPKTLNVGKKFGTIPVLHGEFTFEITRFRKESGYGDGRHPDQIDEGSDYEDVIRRDFTMNGLLLNPFTLDIIDYVEGKKDIQNKVIRFIGNANERIREDHLRILRGIRFQSQLGFQFAESAKEAIQENVELCARVSRERIHQEISKWIEGEYVYSNLQQVRDFAILDHLYDHKKWDWSIFENNQFYQLNGEDRLNYFFAASQMEFDLSWRWSNLAFKKFQFIKKWYHTYPRAFDVAKDFQNEWGKELSQVRGYSYFEFHPLVVAKDIIEYLGLSGMQITKALQQAIEIQVDCKECTKKEILDRIKVQG